MSFAVIASGGRQLRVEAGSLVRVDRLHRQAGDEVTFDRVLMVGTGPDVKIGEPVVEGASVRARVVDERRDRKVLVFKKRHRNTFRKSRGHREWYTLVRIESIEPGN